MTTAYLFHCSNPGASHHHLLDCYHRLQLVFLFLFLIHKAWFYRSTQNVSLKDLNLILTFLGPNPAVALHAGQWPAPWAVLLFSAFVLPQARCLLTAREVQAGAPPLFSLCTRNLPGIILPLCSGPTSSPLSSLYSNFTFLWVTLINQTI